MVVTTSFYSKNQQSYLNERVSNMSNNLILFHCQGWTFGRPKPVSDGRVEETRKKPVSDRFWTGFGRPKLSKTVRH